MKVSELYMFFNDEIHKNMFNELSIKYPGRRDYHALIYLLTSSQWMREVLEIDYDNGPNWSVMNERAIRLGSQHMRLYEFSKNIFGASDTFNFGRAVFTWAEDIWPVAHQAILICRGGKNTLEGGI